MDLSSSTEGGSSTPRPVDRLSTKCETHPAKLRFPQTTPESESKSSSIVSRVARAYVDSNVPWIGLTVLILLVLPMVCGRG